MTTSTTMNMLKDLSPYRLIYKFYFLNVFSSLQKIVTFIDWDIIISSFLNLSLK